MEVVTLKTNEKFYICPECGELTTQSRILEEIESQGGPGLCTCMFIEIVYNRELDDLDPYTARRYPQYIEISQKWYDALKHQNNHAKRLKVFRTIPKERLTVNYHIING